MAGRPTLHTLRPRSSATSTSGRLHWRLPTRKASRSANKAFGLKLQSGGGDPAASFLGGTLSYEGIALHEPSHHLVPRLRVKPCKKPVLLGARDRVLTWR